MTIPDFIACITLKVLGNWLLQVPELFERALRRNSHHRRNLEAYAYFLSGQSDDGALYFFQRSLLTYFEHLRYRQVDKRLET
jgi:hypothetical protein